MTLLMLLALLAVITLPSIIWLYALADATINTFRTFPTKIVWIVALCCFPPIGTLLYLLIGRGQRRTFTLWADSCSSDILALWHPKSGKFGPQKLPVEDEYHPKRDKVAKIQV